MNMPSQKISEDSSTKSYICLIPPTPSPHFWQPQPPYCFGLPTLMCTASDGGGNELERGAVAHLLDAVGDDALTQAAF